MANMTRDDIVAESRRIVGKTDSTKGGADDPTYRKLVNVSIGDLCRDAKALKSVFYLSTKAGDKYVPLAGYDQILWPSQIHFIPSEGLPVPMDPCDGPIFPTGPGIPRRWWWTALNVPDVNGPSTRTIGIDPYTAVDMANVIRIDAYQRAKDLAAAGDIPEVHELFHEGIAARTAYYAALPLKEKHFLLPELRGIYAKTVAEFKEFCQPTRKLAVRTYEVMGYGNYANSRIMR